METVTSEWPTATDLARLRAEEPAYTLTVEAPVPPARALAVWAEPETARRTNPLIISVVTNGQEESADRSRRVSFTVTDQISPLGRCCCSIPVRFPAIFWVPATESAGQDPAADATLYSYAPAACGVTVVNRWTFLATPNGSATTVRQDTWVSAPALLRQFTISQARSAHSEGLRKISELLRDENK